MLPRFLPDGRRFLYWAVTRDGQRTVRAGSIDSPETRQSSRLMRRRVYRAGFLLFQRGATLVAQPFDERTLTLSGEPQAITAEAAPGGSRPLRCSMRRRAACWSSRRRTAASAPPELGRSARQRRRLAAATGWRRAAQPDGVARRHARRGDAHGSATGNWDLWSVDLRSGAPTRLTRQPGIDSDPVWSPDGAELAYVSRRADVHGIYRMSLTDGREQMLLKIGVQVVVQTTRGRRTGRPTVGSWSYEADYDIMALALTTRRIPFRIVATPAVEKSGRVSPDGRWIAYQSDDSGEYQVYVQPFPGPGAAAARVDNDWRSHPQWRGDGRELFWMGRVPAVFHWTRCSRRT